MSAAEKIGHIWTYYRLPALGVLLFAAVAVSITVAMVRGYRAKDNLQVGILGAPTVTKEQVERFAGDKYWDGGLSIATGDGVGDGTGQGFIQLMCLLSADELDVAVCDWDTARFILGEAEMPGKIYRLSDTALGHYVPESEEVYLVVIEETGRAEKTARFLEKLDVADDADEPAY